MCDECKVSLTCQPISNRCNCSQRTACSCLRFTWLMWAAISLIKSSACRSGCSADGRAVSFDKSLSSKAESSRWYLRMRCTGFKRYAPRGSGCASCCCAACKNDWAAGRRFRAVNVSTLAGYRVQYSAYTWKPGLLRTKHSATCWACSPLCCSWPNSVALKACTWRRLANKALNSLSVNGIDELVELLLMLLLAESLLVLDSEYDEGDSNKWTDLVVVADASWSSVGPLVESPAVVLGSSSASSWFDSRDEVKPIEETSGLSGNTICSIGTKYPCKRKRTTQKNEHS